jgi:hypothetical protein
MAFPSAGVILRAWLSITQPLRAFLRRPSRYLWRSLPGDMLGRAVMVFCGISVPTRLYRSGDVTAIVIEDPRTERWLRANTIPLAAQTVGRYVFARERLSDHILEHECEHIRQWQRYGPFYLPLYFGLSAAGSLRRRRVHWDNRLEAAARQKADREMAGRAGATGLAEDETRPKP